MIRIRVAVGFSVLRQVFNVAVALAALPIITQAVGANGFAQVVSAQVTAQLLALVISGSIPAYLIHDVAKSLGPEARSGHGGSNDYALVLSFALPGLLFVAASSETLLPEQIGSWAALAVVFTAVNLLNDFVTAVLVGIQRFVASDVITILCSLLVLGSVWLLPSVLTPLVVLSIYLSTTLVGAFIRLGVLWWLGKLHYVTPHAGDPSRLYRSAAPLLFANFAGLAVYRLHYVIVSVIASPAALGVFALAQQIAEKAWIPAQAVANILFPRFSTLAKGELTKASRKVHAAASVAAVLALAGVFTVSLVPSQFVAQLFGSEFGELPGFLMSMGLGIGAWAAVKVYASLIAAAGAFHLNLWSALITATGTCLGIAVFGWIDESRLGWGLSIGYVVGLVFEIKFLRSVL